MELATMPDLSEEQKHIILSKSKRKVVIARAGTGKTTTVMAYARAKKNARVLYLVYNKAMQEEFDRKIGPWGLTNIVAKTAHSLAYGRSSLIANGRRPVNFISFAEYKELVAMPHLDYKLYKSVMDGLAAFCNSSLSRIEDMEISPTAAMQQLVNYWKKIEKGEAPFTHDVYLKHFAMSNPDLSQDFDLIMLDEAQDANPVIAQLLEKLTCEVVIVGDPEQQIYGWRGADNMMYRFEGERFSLSKSWRFGTHIADQANIFLHYKDSWPKLTGHDRSNEAEGSHAHICRTVAGAIEYAKSMTVDHPDVFIKWNGGIDGYRLGDILDIWHLRNGHLDKIQNNQLKRGFRDFFEYKTSAESSNDLGMLWNIKLVEEAFFSGQNIESIVATLSNKSKAKKHSEQPEIILTTAHRSKGLEFPFVSIHDDFFDVLDSMEKIYVDLNSKSLTKQSKAVESFDRLNEEVNLMYVSITRTQGEFISNSLAIERMLSFGSQTKHRNNYRACKELRSEFL